MSAADFFGLSLRQPWRAFKRWSELRAEAADLRELDMIKRDREHGFELERYLHARIAIRRSDLRNL